MTMLEQALALRKPGKVYGHAGSDEEVELLLAVLRGEITSPQAAAIIYPSIAIAGAYTRISQRVFTVLRQRIADGSLQIVFNEKERK